MSLNDSTLSATSKSENIYRLLATVVHTQEQFVERFASIGNNVDNLKNDFHRALSNLTEGIRRLEIRVEKQVQDLAAAHAAERENLIELLKIQLAKEARMATGGTGATPGRSAMQSYQQGATAQAMFGSQDMAYAQQLMLQQVQQAQAAAFRQQILAQGSPMAAPPAPPVPTAPTMPQMVPTTPATITNTASPKPAPPVLQPTSTAFGSPLTFATPKPAGTPVVVPKVEDDKMPVLTPQVPAQTTAKASLTFGTPKPPPSTNVFSGLSTAVGQTAAAASPAAPKPATSVFGDQKPALNLGSLFGKSTTPVPPAATSSPFSVGPPKLSFATTPTKAPTPGSVVTIPSATVKKEEGEDDEDENKTEDYEPDVHFEPVIPLPALVDVVTGEEGEKVLFEARCKLYRFVAPEWKERGTGTVKVLEGDGRQRVVMRRDQTHKVAANFPIVGGMKVVKMGANDKAVTWNCEDFSEGECQHQNLSARFATALKAEEFMDLLNSLSERGPGGSGVGATPKKEEKKKEIKKEEPEQKTKADEKPKDFAAFLPKAGSWECQGCYTSNPADVTKCPCCGTNKDGSKDESNVFGAKTTTTAPAAGTTAAPAKFSFGLSASIAAKEADEKAKPAAAIPVAKEEPKAREASTFSFGKSSGAPAAFGGGLASGAASFSFKPSTSTTAAATTTNTATATTTSAASSFTFKPATPNIFGGGKLFGQSAPSTGATTTTASTTEVSNTSTTASPFGSDSSFTKSGLSFGSLASGKPNIFDKTDTEKNKEKFAQLAKSKPFGSGAAEKKDEDKEKDKEDDENPEEYECSAEFKPVIPLPDVVEVRTGEEDETIAFQHRAKIYRYVKETNENKERGVGELKLLHDEAKNKYRVVMRREQVHKICANFPVTAQTVFNEKHGMPNCVTVMCTDFTDNATEGNVELLTIKFKEAETAKRFREEANKAKEQMSA